MDTNLYGTRLKKRFNMAGYSVYIIFLLIFAYFSFTTKVFFSSRNMVMLISNSVPMIVVTAGMTYVFITGSMDLSVGATMYMSGIIMNALANAQVPLILAVLVGLLAGIAVGVFNGFIITKLKINPFLGTYATQIAIRNMGLILSGNRAYFVNERLKSTFRSPILNIPLFVILSFLFLIAGQYVLKYTVYGRKVIAVGCHPEAAAKVGIDAEKIRASVYVVAGFFAAFAGLASVLNRGMCNATIGEGVEFNGAIAVIVGGTSTFGGKGSVIPGTLMGVLLIQMIENGLVISGVNSYYIALVRGALIFIAMAFDAIRKK